MSAVLDFTKAKEMLNGANDILIATHERPTPDSIGSALALYLGLVGMGKKVTIVCPDPMVVGLSNFVGANKLQTEVGRKNFVISLDYTEGSIEKVSYNIEGKTFNLVIEPRAGHEAFSEDKVHYSYKGASPDVIITVDTIHLGGLKKTYEDEKELFATKPIINIDRHPNNAQYGQLNLVDARSSSTAELAAQLLGSLGVALTADVATNLLNAVYAATQSFQATSVTPVAFELAAACLKAGGKRFSAEPEVSEERPHEESVQSEPAEGQQQAEGASEAKESQGDWLKPHIFKGSTQG